MAHTELGTNVPCQRLNTTGHYTSTHMHRLTASSHRHQLVTNVRLVRVHITLWQRMIAISWYVSTELSLCNWELHFTWIYILSLLPLITTVLNGRNLYRGISMTPVKLTSYRLAGKKSWVETSLQHDKKSVAMLLSSSNHTITALYWHWFFDLLWIT